MTRVRRSICRRVFGTVLASTAILAFHPALADETIKYTYDERGRLIEVSRSGTVNNNLHASYTYDKADNRSNVTASTVPSFGITGASATEGSGVVFTVRKSGTASGTLTVAYATSGGTATSGSDFTAKSGTLTFLASDTSKTISVTTADDSGVEGTETFAVSLSNPSTGSVLGAGMATGTILDNEVGSPPSFSVSNVSVTEGGNLVFTITKTGSTSSAYAVDYFTDPGSATSGGDYTATAGTLIFAGTDTTKTVTVATANDTTVENAEVAYLKLTRATGGADISNFGAGTINDNDGVSFSISDGWANEGGQAYLTITKTGSTPGTYTVQYATAPGRATTTDYVSESGTLTFGTTSTGASISIQVRADTRAEYDEYFYVNLSQASVGATISDNQGVVSIFDSVTGSLSAPGSDPVEDSSAEQTNPDDGTSAEPPAEEPVDPPPGNS